MRALGALVSKNDDEQGEKEVTSSLATSRRRNRTERRKLFYRIRRGGARSGTPQNFPRLAPDRARGRDASRCILCVGPSMRVPSTVALATLVVAGCSSEVIVS